MLKPINDRILVRLRPRQEMSNGGIAIPEAAQRAEEWGEVIEVGDKVKDITKGDIVFIRATQGTNIGNDTILIEEFRVVAKMIDVRPVDNLSDGEK